MRPVRPAPHQRALGYRAVCLNRLWFTVILFMLSPSNTSVLVLYCLFLFVVARLFGVAAGKFNLSTVAQSGSSNTTNRRNLLDGTQRFAVARVSGWSPQLPWS